MTPLHCSTVQEALWERAASSGPAPLSPALAEHLSSCPACQTERRAVGDLLEVSSAIADPTPPADIWEGFSEALERGIGRGRPGLDRWSRAAMGLAATLIVGFALGAVWMRTVDRPPVTADVRPEAGAVIDQPRDPRMDLYLEEIETVLVAYRASEQGDAVDVFRRSVPATMLAGEGVLPSEAARQRLEQQRAAREQLRTLVLAMLASEIESERTGFGYIERRIAEIAGQELLILVH